MSRIDAVEARLRRLDPPVVDRAAAFVLAVAVVANAGSQRPFSPVVLLGGLAAAGSVALRRRAPVGAILLTLVGATVISRTGAGSLLVVPLAFGLNYYLAGRLSADRGWSWIDAALLLLPVPFIATDPSTPSPGNPLILDVVSVWAFFLVLPFAAGRAVGTWTRVNEALRRNAQRLDDEQRERARHAVTQERTRIARELHDVVAHSVSVMVIQTAAARRVAGRDRAAAAQALLAVETCGRDALIDMRRMMGVLHRGDIDLLGGAAPGLSQLGKLADRACASGLRVAVRIEGEARPLPPGLDLVVFRVVQEALTNAIKHAGPASAQVRVAFGADALEIEIIDSGGGPAPRRTAPAQPLGHGLVGMQERLTLYGGQLRTGRSRDGGFQVSARIPLTDPVPAYRSDLSVAAARPLVRPDPGRRDVHRLQDRGQHRHRSRSPARSLAARGEYRHRRLPHRCAGRAAAHTAGERDRREDERPAARARHRGYSERQLSATRVVHRSVLGRRVLDA